MERLINEESLAARSSGSADPVAFSDLGEHVEASITRAVRAANGPSLPTVAVPYMLRAIDAGLREHGKALVVLDEEDLAEIRTELHGVGAIEDVIADWEHGFLAPRDVARGIARIVNGLTDGKRIVALIERAKPARSAEEPQRGDLPS